MGVERDCGEIHMYVKQETLCSAATPSSPSRVGGEKVKVHEAFLSDTAYFFEKKCLSHSHDRV